MSKLSEGKEHQFSFRVYFEDTDQIIRIPSRYTSESQNVLVVSKRRNIPLLVPGLGNFLGRELQSEAIGVAVIENQP